MKTKINKIIILTILSLLVLPGSFISAKGQIDPAFNPGLLIPDSAFIDVGTFGTAAGIQKFLELKGSVLANTNPNFLVKLNEPNTSIKEGLEDPEANLSRLRTAAELIYDAAMHWGLNPQVLIASLQKEQSLVTGTFKSNSELQTALNHAVGFGCPDHEICGEVFNGFYQQLFGNFDSEGNRWLGSAASLMRSYNTTVNGKLVGRGPMVDSSGNTSGGAAVRVSHKGDTIILSNTLGGYDGVAATQTVTLQNLATAALYRYTPHVFNGNYNFWKFYTAWFKYPNGTVIRRLNELQQYVIDNSAKRPFSDFVASQRKLDVTNVVTVSQTEFDSYTTEKPLPPNEGTLIKGDTEPTVYLISNSSKLPISGPVFTQRKFSFKKVITIPQAEVASYDSGTFVPPLDGTLVLGQSDPTVYLIDGGQKRPISGVIFSARKYSFRNILKLSDAEISSLEMGPYLTPIEKTAIKSPNDPTIWWFRDNTKHQVSAFVYKQRGVGYFPLLTLSDAEMANIAVRAALPPNDGTVIKADTSSAIFFIQGGLKHLLTPAAYQRLRYPKPVVLSQGEVDLYPAGDDIVK